MRGGSRLLIAFFLLFIGMATMITAKAKDAPSPSGPPKAKVAAVYAAALRSELN